MTRPDQPLEVRERADSDLPSRTWRGWWLAWPKWFRIGCWAGLGVLLSYLLIVLRLVVGQWEDGNIQAIQQRGGQVCYSWLPFLSAQTAAPAYVGLTEYDWLNAGFWGRNSRHVIEIKLPGAADADLRDLCARFPNLKSLMLTEATVSSTGLAQLAALRDLRSIYIHDSDIGDDEAIALTTIPTLALISLNETRVTDAIISHLQQMTLLRVIGLYFTDVSSEAIAAWSATGKWVIQCEKRGDVAEDLYGTFRWSDGRQNDRFLGSAVIEVEGPLSTEQQRKTTKNLPQDENMVLFVPYHLHWSAAEIAKFADGDYRFALKLGDYEAEPVIIHVENGKPSVSRFEFQMPVTRDQALEKKP